MKFSELLHSYYPGTPGQFVVSLDKVAPLAARLGYWSERLHLPDTSAGPAPR